MDDDELRSLLSEQTRKIDQIEQVLSDMDDRLENVTAQLAALPTRDEITEQLEMLLAALQGIDTQNPEETQE